MSDLEMKSFGPFEIKSEDKGEVVAIVATLGVVDKDGDVILPGAFGSGARVKLSGYGHDVITEGKAPVGKGIITEDGDKAIFKGQFFMSTQRGREAFLTTKELGPEGEWSFGFPKNVKAGDLSDDWKAKGAKRVIAGLTAIEASPVFVGAGWGTGTLSAKAAEDVAVEPLAEEPAAEAQPDWGVPGTESFDRAAYEAAMELAADAAEVSAVVVSDVSQAIAEAVDAEIMAEVPAEPVETEEAKAAREAEAAYKAARDEAMEEFHRVQRAIKRMGYAA